MASWSVHHGAAPPECPSACPPLQPAALFVGKHSLGASCGLDRGELRRLMGLHDRLRVGANQSRIGLIGLPGLDQMFPALLNGRLCFLVRFAHRLGQGPQALSLLVAQLQESASLK